MRYFINPVMAGFAILVTSGLSIQISDSVRAQTFFSSTKIFTVTRSCNATTSLSGSNPVALTVGKGYTALGENQIPNGTYAWISVSGVGNRWVALSCGTYGTVTPPSPPPSSTLPPGTLPFFDNINNPVTGLKLPSTGSADVTPVAPTLTAFDNTIVNLCGAPGKVVSTSEFKSVMNANPTVLANIKAYVSPTAVTSDFLNDLTSIWFAAKGFDHVFCGEPQISGPIGGLHFFGRYLELQNKGLAGRLANNAANEEVVSGAVYTVGAKIRVPGGFSQSTIKGYGLTLNAEEILRIGAILYKKNPNTTATSKACIASVNDDGKAFKEVFVAKNGGVRTLYPDATPSSTDPNCN